MEPAASDQKTVLVVDDESIVRMHAADLLEQAGYRVIEASNGEEALAALNRSPEISVLFSDINMPGLDGFELARAVHALRPDVHLILTSALSRSTAEMVESEAIFIHKPYSALQVVKVIEDGGAPPGSGLPIGRRAARRS